VTAAPRTKTHRNCNDEPDANASGDGIGCLFVVLIGKYFRVLESSVGCNSISSVMGFVLAVN